MEKKFELTDETILVDEKTCENCVYCECCPCLPPCLEWEECLHNNWKMFEPTLFCKR